MTAWIFSLIDHFGYYAIALLIAIENVFPPIPSELILSFGGFMVTKTQMNMPGLIISSTIGALIGALILYWIGTLLSEERLEKLFDHQLFKNLGFKKDDVKRAINWFEKHGIKTIFFGRFVPVIRSLISIPAGTAHVNMGQFILLTTLGSMIWNTVLICLGSYMGSKWHIIVTIFEDYSFIVVIILCLLLFYGAFWWYKTRLKK